MKARWFIWMVSIIDASIKPPPEWQKNLCKLYVDEDEYFGEEVSARILEPGNLYLVLGDFCSIRSYILKMEKKAYNSKIYKH